MERVYKGPGLFGTTFCADRLVWSPARGRVRSATPADWTGLPAGSGAEGAMDNLRSWAVVGQLDRFTAHTVATRIDPEVAQGEFKVNLQLASGSLLS